MAIRNAIQGTPDWFRQRLGKITGSDVWMLTQSGRKKDDLFSETAKKYIYQLAAERSMNPLVVNDDLLFAEYLEQTDITSRAMRWGTEQEPSARALYIKLSGIRMLEVSSISHPLLQNFASSPDGYSYDENKEETGVLEIKCTGQANYMRFKHGVKDGATLKEVEPKYFYQCQAHIMCLSAQWCDFVCYNPFQSEPIHIARVLPDKEAISFLSERVILANDMIDAIVIEKSIKETA